MLESSLHGMTVEQAWSELTCRVALPAALAEDLEKEGPLEIEYDPTVILQKLLGLSAECLLEGGELLGR